jgi:polysaccharide biosynthesis/export protein
MNLFRKIFVVMLGFSFLAGCAGKTVMGGAPGLKVSDASALPPPTAADMIVQSQDYLIGPYDKLSISVFGIEGLEDKEIQADGGGRISFPLIGQIDAAGKTTLQVTEIIAARLRASFVRDPQVNVNLKETLSQLVTIDGAVKEPGLYPVLGRMTLMRAIATAKGTDEFAKLSHVAVFRKVSGQDLVAVYNLKAVRDGQTNDPQIFANDVVVVGDNAVRRLFKDALLALPAVTTPLVYVLTR